MTIRRRDPPQFVVSHVVAGALYHTGTFNAGLSLAGAVIVSRAVIGAAGWPALRAVRTPVRTLIAAKLFDPPPRLRFRLTDSVIRNILVSNDPLVRVPGYRGAVP